MQYYHNSILYYVSERYRMTLATVSIHEQQQQNLHQMHQLMSAKTLHSAKLMLSAMEDYVLELILGMDSVNVA